MFHITRYTLASRTALMVASGLSLISVSQAVQAQDAEDDTSGLGEIVVTAQKRAENAQDVPITITALGAESLESRQVAGIEDLVKLVPSMFVGQNYGANVVTIRGVSTGATSGAEDPSIATHVNGVYQPRSRSIDLAAMDLERVEVLSGPQGTLYGRNATGGVINYVLKKPTDTFEAGVTLSAGNFERFGLKGYVSGPLSENVNMRVSGLWEDQGKGFIKNLLPGAPNKTFGDTNNLGIHAALAIEASDNVRFDIDGIYARSKSSNIFEVYEPTVYGAFIAGVLGRQSFKPHEVYSPYPSKFNSKYFQGSFTATFDLSDNVQLKSITAYQGYQDQMNIDNSGSEFLAVSVDQNDRSRTFTQELNLTTKAFDERLSSVFGFFYYREKLTVDTPVQFLIASAFNPTTPTHYIYATDQTAKSWAFFTDQTFHVSDQLRLIGGLRYNHDSKAQDNALSGGFDFVTVFPFGTASNKKSWNSWSPKVGVQFDASDDVMVYAGWQKAFKAGGYTANTLGDPYDPETLQGFEVGLKSELLDRRLRLNLAAYQYKYKDLQVQKVVGIGQFSVENAASATLKGIEMSALAKLSDAITIDLTGNIQSAKYDEFFNCDNTDPTGPCNASPPIQADLSGNWLNRAPPYTLNLGAEYRAELGSGSLTFRAESFWSGRVRFDPYQTNAQMSQKPYSVQNLFLTYRPDDKGFHARAYVKNLFKEDYKSAAFYSSATGQATGSWASPRTFGVEVGFDF